MTITIAAATIILTITNAPTWTITTALTCTIWALILETREHIIDHNRKKAQ